MCATNDFNRNEQDSQSESPEAYNGPELGRRLVQALQAFGYWPTEELWQPDSIRAWIVEEMEAMTPLHLHALMMVVTGLRVMELAEHVEYVEEVLEDVGHGSEEV